MYDIYAIKKTMCPHNHHDGLVASHELARTLWTSSTEFSNYDPGKTSFAAVVIALAQFLF